MLAGEPRFEGCGDHADVHLQPFRERSFERRRQRRDGVGIVAELPLRARDQVQSFIPRVLIACDEQAPLGLDGCRFPVPLPQARDGPRKSH